MDNEDRKEFVEATVQAIFDACPDGFVVAAIEIHMHKDNDLCTEAQYTPEEEE
jgi:hypothetical protein